MMAARFGSGKAAGKMREMGGKPRLPAELQIPSAFGTFRGAEKAFLQNSRLNFQIFRM